MITNRLKTKDHDLSGTNLQLKISGKEIRDINNSQEIKVNKLVRL